MIRLSLTGEQRRELDHRRRQHGPSPIPAVRLEMIRLADLGWHIPVIAAHLGCHHQTVRKFVKQFRDHGFPGLTNRPLPGRRPRLTEDHLGALEDLLDHTGRTWTAPQLAAWLRQERHVSVHPDYLSIVLHRRGFAWKRSKRSVAHQRKEKDIDQYLAKVQELARLKAKRSAAS